MSFEYEQRLLASLEGPLAQTQDAEALKGAYNTLLTYYPLLFGYWIKYTEIDPEAWPRALAACPALELWERYLDLPGADSTRYEAAVSAVGRFFQSHVIWDRYLEHEQDPVAKARILGRVIHIPLYQYAKYFQAARVAIKEHPEAFDGIDIDVVAQQTAQAVNDRWAFESRLTRPYFHVVPLEKDELQAWDQYLDFEEAGGNAEAIETLYIRCLVVTALYPGFWKRYIRWISLIDPTKVDGVFDKAVNYVRFENAGQTERDRARWSTQRAYYREAAGDIEGARVIYDSLPTYPETSKARAAFALRQGTQESVKPEDQLAMARLRKSSEGITDPNVLLEFSNDPEQLFNLWKQGKITDSAALLEKLRSLGDFEKYFHVDISTNGTRKAKENIKN